MEPILYGSKSSWIEILEEPRQSYNKLKKSFQREKLKRPSESYLLRKQEKQQWI